MTLAVIGTDGTGSCKSSYHTITTTMASKKRTQNDTRENYQLDNCMNLYSSHDYHFSMLVE